MPTTACTPSIYTTVITGYLPGSGTTTGTIVTFNTPKPVWTDSDGVNDLQCGAVAIGGFNGLNN